MSFPRSPASSLPSHPSHHLPQRHCSFSSWTEQQYLSEACYKCLPQRGNCSPSVWRLLVANIIPLFIRDFSFSSQTVSVTERVPSSRTSCPAFHNSYNLIVILTPVALLVCIKFPAANLPIYPAICRP